MDAPDVVVVGAGIVGAATAYHLARAGVRTMLVDRADPGHATRAGAGIVCPVTATVGHDELVDLAFAGADHYATLAAWVDQDRPDPAGCGFSMVGMLSVGLGGAGDDHVAATASWADHVARTTPWGALTGHSTLEPPDARSRCPILSPDLATALAVEWGGRVDGDRFRHALVEAARRRGVDVRAGTVRAVGEGSVDLDGETVPCGRVVICSGAWTSELVPHYDVVRPVRGEILHVDGPGLDTSGWPLIEIEDVGPYLIPWGGSRLAVGATVDPSGDPDARPRLAGLRWCIEALDRATGGDADHYRLVECRVGFRPASADGLPLIGPLPDRPGIIMATGHGADGLSWGPFTGRLVAEVITGEQVSIDLTPFDPGRFDRRGQGHEDVSRPDHPTYAHARRLPT